MRKSAIVLGGLTAAAVLVGLAYGQDKTKITIESWRNDDLKIWNTQIIPAFNKKYPNIEVIFAPSAPTEYNAALDAKTSGRIGRRPDHLPPLRPVARNLPERSARGFK